MVTMDECAEWWHENCDRLCVLPVDPEVRPRLTHAPAVAQALFEFVNGLEKPGEYVNGLCRK